VVFVAVAACTGEGTAGAESEIAAYAAALASIETPPDLTAGETLFDTHCSACHGGKALGTDAGPPLVHIVYEPGHHADAAFVLAVQRGVRAHHWRFGDMPPLPAVSPEQTGEIIRYVRFLQRQVGIS
jgi:mono/diheme cytochrome c family protein